MRTLEQERPGSTFQPGGVLTMRTLTGNREPRSLCLRDGDRSGRDGELEGLKEGVRGSARPPVRLPKVSAPFFSLKDVCVCLCVYVCGCVCLCVYAEQLDS